MSQTIHVFDAYGTLFDVHSAVGRKRAEIGPQADRLSEIWRAKTLEYTWVLSLSGRQSSFRKLLMAALDYALAATDTASPERREGLLKAYDELSAYPEVKDALQELRRKRSRVAVLSNGDGDMLDIACRSAGIETLFDAVLSASEVGIFKPSSRVYRLAMTKFGATRDQIVFVSSNRWDVAGATAFGFKSVWVNRSGAHDEYPDMPASAVVSRLDELPFLASTPTPN
jgi:2-haloacid dehalogenase